MKSQIQDFFHLLKRFVGRVNHKGIQIQIPLKFVSVETDVRIRECLHELSEDLQPNHDAADLDRGQKRRRVLSVSGCNPAPLLQLEECVFDKMAELVKIFIVSSFLFPILL